MAADMFLVSPDQMREIDRLVIEELGVPGIVLMEHAALGACRVLVETFPDAKTVAIFCGPGNNGGDGLAMARLLAHRGLHVQIILATDPQRFSGDAQTNLHICARLGLEFVVLPETPEALHDIHTDVFVDALLGTGIDRMVDPQSTLGAAIEFLATRSSSVLAVDIPSGIHGRSGQIAGIAVRAAVTATFGAPKLGLALQPGREHAGRIEVIDIGIPLETLEDVGWDAVWLQSGFLDVPRRPAAMHKGDAGRVLVVGGSPGFAGAAIMASQAALARGAGLVTVATHSEHRTLAVSSQPELMTLDFNDDEALIRALQGSNCVVVGPGLGQSVKAHNLLAAALEHGARLVLDADALNLLAQERMPIPAGSVLTPHPGEAARLLQRPVQQILLDLVGAALELATLFESIVVVKGASSVIAAPDGRLAVNGTGNPGMATAGMGDVLAGLIAATLCESDDTFEAVCHAVCLHGHAADRAATRFGQRGLVATDIIQSVRLLWPELESP